MEWFDSDGVRVLIARVQKRVRCIVAVPAFVSTEGSRGGQSCRSEVKSQSELQQTKPNNGVCLKQYFKFVLSDIWKRSVVIHMS